MFKGSTDTLFVKEIFLSLGKTMPKSLSMRYPNDYVSFEYSVLTPSLGRETSLKRPTFQRHCPFWTYTQACLEHILTTQDWRTASRKTDFSWSMVLCWYSWFYYIYIDNFTHNSTTIQAHLWHTESSPHCQQSTCGVEGWNLHGYFICECWISYKSYLWEE